MSKLIPFLRAPLAPITPAMSAAQAAVGVVQGAFQVTSHAVHEHHATKQHALRCEQELSTLREGVRRCYGDLAVSQARWEYLLQRLQVTHNPREQAKLLGILERLSPHERAQLAKHLGPFLSHNPRQLGAR